MNNNISKDAFVPTIQPDLLRYLDQLFPERCARLGESEQDIFFYSGQRAVVLYLNRIFQEQNDNVL